MKKTVRMVQLRCPCGFFKISHNESMLQAELNEALKTTIRICGTGLYLYDGLIVLLPYFWAQNGQVTPWGRHLGQGRYDWAGRLLWPQLCDHWPRLFDHRKPKSFRVCRISALGLLSNLREVDGRFPDLAYVNILWALTTRAIFTWYLL